MEPSPPIPSPSSPLRLSASLIDQFDFVHVTVAGASPGDWLGVYCLEQDGSENAVAVGDFLDRRETTQVGHEETFAFGPLVNMRCALQFRLLAADGSTRATAPNVVQFRQGHAQPTQRHLAVTSKATEMRVAWTSANVTYKAPRVRYGEDLEVLEREASALEATYDANDMCAAPATTRGPRMFRDPGVIYDATMTGLVPGKTYFYQVGSGEDDEAAGWSDVRAFKMPPLAGTTADNHATTQKPLSLFLLGDLMAPVDATQDFRVAGSCGTTMELIERDLLDQHTHEREYTALVHVGDLSYAAGRTYVWDHFGALIEPIASRIPYMVSIGNHDFGYLEARASAKRHVRAPTHVVFDADETKGFDSHGECGVPSEARFRMPENGRGMYWYSFEIGLTHHTVLSGEHDFVKGAPMHEWLLKDLAKVDRAKTPWLFVHIHRPLYCSVAFGGDFVRSLYLRDHLERVLAEFRVDAVFSGHYHSYERTCPVYDDKCHYGPQGEAQAPVHIMVGSGGANVDTYGHYRVGWSESAKLTHGYGRLHVFNASHAQFDFVQNDVRTVTDSMWIVSDHKWSVHENWRWRRVVLHPTLPFTITAAVAGVLFALISLLRKKRWQRRFSKHRFGSIEQGDKLR